jgi:hypothetical protein
VSFSNTLTYSDLYIWKMHTYLLNINILDVGLYFVWVVISYKQVREVGLNKVIWTLFFFCCFFLTEGKSNVMILTKCCILILFSVLIVNQVNTSDWSVVCQYQLWRLIWYIFWSSCSYRMQLKILVSFT